ncbi:MAG: FeoB small GTPase domain-containing protein, partial [Campylobacterales bacterium]
MELNNTLQTILELQLIKKSAEFKLDEHTIELIDLPGTYSLSSYSDEESVATSEL